VEEESLPRFIFLDKNNMNSINDFHYYEVNLLWNSAAQGTLSSPIMPSEIKVELSPEFPKPIKGKWIPEHLFIAAVSCSLMSTFLLAANNSKLKFISFECNAIGKIERVNGKVVVTEIIIEPKLTIPSTQNETKARRVIELSEKAMAIANSVKTKITMYPFIAVQ